MQKAKQKAMSSPTPTTTQSQPVAAAAADDDDDFAAFSSAIPVSTILPALSPNEIRVLAKELQIVLEFDRSPPMPGEVNLEAKFSNGCGDEINDITFQLAVSKVMYNSSNGYRLTRSFTQM
jgi:hypothetical protein